MKRESIARALAACVAIFASACNRRATSGDSAPAASTLAESVPQGMHVVLSPRPSGQEVSVEIRVVGPMARNIRALRATRGWGGTRPLEATTGLVVSDARGPIDVLPPVTEGAFSLLRLARSPEHDDVRVRYTARAGGDVSRFSLRRGDGGLSSVGHAFVLRPALEEEMPLSLLARAPSGERVPLATSLDGRVTATAEDLAAAVYVIGRFSKDELPPNDVVMSAFGAQLDPRSARDVISQAHRFADELAGAGERRATHLFVIGERGMGAEHDGASTGGAIAVWLDPTRGLDDGVKILLAHEALHALFGGSLRIDAAGRDAAWFSEGMATHYARRALFDQRAITAESFIADVERERGASQGGETDGGAHALGYGLGSRYAALVDVEVRSRSGGARSLDHVVRSLADAARKTPGEPIALNVFRSIVAAEIGSSRERELWDALVVGALPPLPDDAFGPCFRRVATERTVAALGFDPASLDASPQIIRGVSPGSSAERAGIKDGALVLRSSVRAGQPLDPDVDVELVLAGRKGKQVVRYKPAKKETIRVFRPQACAR